MARPKKQHNRKENIIDAAQKLFNEKGFEKTTMEEIAKHTGISKGSIYLDFKNKDEINMAIARRIFKFMIEQMQADIKIIKMPYLEEFKKLIIKDSLTVYDLVASKIHSYTSLILSSYQVKLELSDMFQEKYNIIASILEKAANNNEIAPCENYSELTNLIYISLQGFFPPYALKYSSHYRTNLNAQEIRAILLKDISAYAEIILSGLKTAKYNKIFINN